MKPEEVKNRKDFMIYFLIMLNNEGRQLDLGEAFFNSGYGSGIESFEGIIDEMDEKGWIKKKKTPSGSVPGIPQLQTIRVTYEITFDGIEYLASIGKIENKYPSPKKSDSRNININGNNINYSEQTHGDLSFLVRQENPKANPTKDETTLVHKYVNSFWMKTVSKIITGVIIGILIWFLTTQIF